MGTLTVKLPAPLEAKLEALVRKRRRSKSVLVREAIERLVADEGEPGSIYELIKDLKGVGAGPPDLSTNPKYMKDYGK
ncbi:MAG: ribbon-helix-helix domain-containing protein [Alphaproteobacteria bacterium]